MPPPFQTELEEEQVKPLPFLSSRVRDHPSKRGAPKLFAAEPAESSEPGPCHRRQRQVPGGSQQPQHGVKPKKVKTTSVFGEEGEEDDLQKDSKHVATTLFGVELEEQEESTDGDDVDFEPTSKSVFAFGWHSLSSYKSASFWKENMDDPKSEKSRRTYDNTKRKASAMYTRRGSGEVYKKNGIDPARLHKLISATECHCSTPELGKDFPIWITNLNYQIYV